jgi:tryptophan synthase beta chain
MSREMGGAQIYLKREDLNHTGAHKINNTIGQACWPSAWASRASLPKPAQASTAWPPPPSARAMAGMCGVHGRGRCEAPKPQRVPHEAAGRHRGARGIGSKTLKDALNEAMRDWVANVDNTFYIIGTVAGPHPYPMMVRDFQSVIGKNA